MSLEFPLSFHTGEFLVNSIQENAILEKGTLAHEMLKTDYEYCRKTHLTVTVGILRKEVLNARKRTE